MVAFSAATMERYEQARAFVEYVVGKTADEVLAIETVLNEEGHQVAVDETLLAGCTISIDGMMKVVAKAVGYAG